MNFDDLTAEQQERVRNAKTPAEILALAREEGYELSDEELESVSGGGDWGMSTCVGAGCEVCNDYKGCKCY